MGWFERLFGGPVESVAPEPAHAPVLRRPSAATFDLNSPQMLEFIRSGGDGGGDWKRCSANLRCVTIIANALGMLPCNLNQLDAAGNTVGKASDNPVHRVLARRSNNYQTPFVFKRAMFMQALLRGNAYALPIKVGSRVTELIPLPRGTVRTEQTSDFSVVHIAQSKKGERRYAAGELVHLMGPSEDGITGLSMLDAARDTLALWRDSAASMRAAAQNAVSPGGALEFPEGQELTNDMHARLKADVNDEYGGPSNNNKWMVLENGLKARPFQINQRELQAVEGRNQQVEDIARIYGVPRPFLMLDDTSWGTGVEQLAIFFVQYALAPWMVAWEQAVMLSLIPESDFEKYQVKFNERALLRGSMKDQAEFLSKLLGGTQNPGVFDQNEARGWLDLAPKAGGDQLFSPVPAQQQSGV